MDRFSKLLPDSIKQKIYEFDNTYKEAYMFGGAKSFNQPIGKWNTTNVTNMKGMFMYATHFNQSIGEWDTSEVTYMYDMFLEAENFNHENAPWYHE
jgi:surface protein